MYTRLAIRLWEFHLPLRRSPSEESVNFKFPELKKRYFMPMSMFGDTA